MQFGDLPGFVDFDYLARVNVATLATLADAPARQANAPLIAVKLTNTTTLTWNANTEPDLAGYEVVWRHTTTPLWQHSVSVGKAHPLHPRSLEGQLLPRSARGGQVGQPEPRELPHAEVLVPV